MDFFDEHRLHGRGPGGPADAQLRGALGCQIQVPRAALAEAQDLLAAMREAGEKMSGDEGQADDAQRDGG